MQEKAGDRIVLLDPAGRELITLNPVGSVVWELADGDHSVEELAGRLAQRFPAVPAEQVAADVAAFVAELSSMGLLVADGG